MSELNIFQRMAAITNDLAVVQKNLAVKTGKSQSYKAVAERDILDAVKPLENKYGIYSYPMKRDILESHILETETFYLDKASNVETRSLKSTFMSRIKTTYRFVNVDDPKDYIDQESIAEGIDAQDKGSGKAMTYSDKYALMKAYKISTGDDPDQDASVERHYNQQSGELPFRVVQTNIQNMVSVLNQSGMNIPEIASAVGKSEKDFRSAFVNESAGRKLEKDLSRLMDRIK